MITASNYFIEMERIGIETLPETLKKGHDLVVKSTCIDSLDPAKFRRITRWGDVRDVLAGIAASEDAGLTPIKLNAVVIRGFNDEDVVDLPALTLNRPWQFRFTEVMPFADVAEFQQATIVTTLEMIERIQARLGTLTSANGGLLDGEAQMFRLPNARGTVGFISPVSAPFCASYNRVRLSADGTLACACSRTAKST